MHVMILPTGAKQPSVLKNPKENPKTNTKEWMRPPELDQVCLEILAKLNTKGNVSDKDLEA